MGTLFPGENPPPPGSTEAGARVEDSTRASEGPGPFVMACATLAGDGVVNRRGENLGRLDHVMIHVPSGRIAYGVLAHGGVLGIGEKLFAIPWDAFTLDAARQCFVIDVERERLERTPGFDRDHWPDMADPGWTNEARAHR